MLNYDNPNLGHLTMHAKEHSTCPCCGQQFPSRIGLGFYPSANIVLAGCEGIVLPNKVLRMLKFLYDNPGVQSYHTISQHVWGADETKWPYDGYKCLQQYGHVLRRRICKPYNMRLDNVTKVGYQLIIDEPELPLQGDINGTSSIMSASKYARHSAKNRLLKHRGLAK